MSTRKMVRNAQESQEIICQECNPIFGQVVYGPVATAGPKQVNFGGLYSRKCPP